MMEEVLNLSDEEKEAKQLFFQIYDAYDTEIGYPNGERASLNNLPQWFDEEKFKTGQQFYKRYKFAISITNLLGLTILLAEPTGLDILLGTGKSSTVETARKRYVETAVHLDTWYECDLSCDSDLWKSLNRVRYLHVAASKSSIKKNIGFISETEVAITVFGFMGFALIKPHLFGISSANHNEREGFIHFWAVMSWIMGVSDELNYCLRSIKVCETVCYIMLRYVFAPLIQLEFEDFELMTRAVVDGLSQFVRIFSFESHMFIVRQACGIPGYQFAVDLSKEFLVHDIFTESEVSRLNATMTRHRLTPNERCYFSKDFQLITNYKTNTWMNNNRLNVKKTVIKPKDFQRKLNHSKFYQLDVRSKIYVIFCRFQMFINRFTIGRWLNNGFVTLFQRKMMRWYTKEFQRSPIT